MKHLLCAASFVWAPSKTGSLALLPSKGQGLRANEDLKQRFGCCIKAKERAWWPWMQRANDTGTEILENSQVECTCTAVKVWLSYIQRQELLVVFLCTLVLALDGVGILWLGRSVWYLFPVLARLWALPSVGEDISSILSDLISPKVAAWMVKMWESQGGHLDHAGGIRPLPTGMLPTALLEGGKEENVAGTHTSKRKKHVSCTHSCHLCLVTGRRTPTWSGPNSRRQGVPKLPTLKNSLGNGQWHREWGKKRPRARNGTMSVPTFLSR